MPKMVDYLQKAGVDLRPDEEVQRIAVSGKSIQNVITDKGEYKADEVVLAAGSWTGKLAKQLDLKIPLQAGEGISYQRGAPYRNPISGSIDGSQGSGDTHEGIYQVFGYDGVFGDQQKDQDGTGRGHC